MMNIFIIETERARKGVQQRFGHIVDISVSRRLANTKVNARQRCK